MSRYSFEALLKPVGNGFEVTFPDIPNCITQGSSFDNAIYMAADALEVMLEAMLKDDDEIPLPTYGRQAPIRGFAVIVSVEPNPRRIEDSVTTKEAAILLGVSDSRARAMVRDGVLPSRKIGRDRLIPIWAIKERINNPRSAGRPRKEPAAA
jgi:excisionase family DNA binding protein